MSNAGQAALTIVGTVVGSYFGNPQLGFLLGSLAGQALFPTQLPHLQGPRLADGQQTTSTVGTPIPWVFGTQRVGGTVIWASPIREEATTEEVGGKGGPEQSQTTYTYYRSFAILLCEGPIGGIRRIWANGKLVYDRTNPADQQELSAGSLQELLVQIAAMNSQLENKMTVYLGTEDQMPDPTIESFEGAGNVPAYRGYAYVVFDDVELKPEDGLRIPAQWSFEVYETGDEDAGIVRQYHNEVLYPWLLGQLDPREPRNTHNYKFAKLSGPEPTISGYTPSDHSDEQAVKIEMVSAYNADKRGGLSQLSVSDLSLVAINSANQLDFFPIVSITGDPVTIAFRYNEISPRRYELSVPAGGGSVVLEYLKDHGDDVYFRDGPSGGGNSGTAFLDTPDITNIHFRHPTVATARFTNFEDTEFEVYYTVDLVVNVNRVPVPPPDPCDVGTRILGIDGYAIVDGRLVRCGPWTYDDTTTYKALAVYTVSGGDNSQVTAYPLNPILPSDHDDYDNQGFWEAAYAEAVARNLMPAGLTYNVDYPKTQDFGYYKDNDYTTVDPAPVSLASIVSRICERVGLFDYDTSDLEEEFVIGYQISRPMAARAAIEPLRSVGFFDVVESGIQIKFPTRGKAAVATLDEDDLGAHFAQEDKDSRLTSQKQLELEIPRQVRVHFQNSANDFLPGEELSHPQSDYPAGSVLDVELAVAISPTKAAQVAEVIHAEARASKWTHGTQVDQSHSAIEPSDCILVPIDDRLERCRVAALTDQLPNLRILELVRDDDGVYEPVAIGSSNQRTTPVIAFFAPSDMEFLDLPPLTVDHDGAGFYIAGWPKVIDGGFRGATLMRSEDGGGSFSLVGSVTTAAVVGRLVSALPSGPTTIFDEGNELRVELLNGELESRQMAEVLAGANTAAIGAHGRWEIVQFVDAENLAGKVWRLTTLLRGRRGTEHAVGSSEEGDLFVLLSDGAIGRVNLNVADINAPIVYRIATIGSVLPKESTSFTCAGVSLRPFAPTHVQGERDSSGNLTITWVRRDRMQLDYVPGEATLMSEELEDYEVDIIDSSGEVQRTLSVSNRSAVYSAAQQTTDFGSVQSSVTVRVYQISTAVGRGYGAQETI